MNWYAFSLPSRFSWVRRSRSSCWYDPWNLRTVAASSLKCVRPLSASSATNVLRYWLAILIASTLLGFGACAGAFGSIAMFLFSHRECRGRARSLAADTQNVYLSCKLSQVFAL